MKQSTIDSPKTVKSFIKLCDRIASTDLGIIKGVKYEEEYELMAWIRAAVQNYSYELKDFLDSKIEKI